MSYPQVCRYSRPSVCCCVGCFCPKEPWCIAVTQHTPNTLRNGMVCPLAESILLRSIGHGGLPPDASRTKICLEGIAYVFATTITSEAFNFASRSKLYS